MPTVRQMPELLLRGSLVNVTMANLTESERDNVSSVMSKVTKHPGIAKHRHKFITELGNTIGADYRDDRNVAELEFQIAVWRATVSLLYHRKYTFKCSACESSSYDTKKGRPIMMDRQYPVCPNCNKILIVDPGDTSFNKGDYVSNDEFQESYKHFGPDRKSPICATPITFVGGNKTYENPEKVLSDDRQLVKFFSEFVWNYFRQILRENNRTEHQKVPQLISDRADRVIVQEIISLCSSWKQDYNYCNKTQPRNGVHNIKICCNKTPPEFTAELIKIIETANTNSIAIEFDDDSIKVLVNTHAPFITAYVIKPEHVMIMDNCQSETGDEDGGFELSDTADRRDKMRESHTATIEIEDAIETIRESLPDHECQQIFDILSSRGDSYDEYSDKYGDGKTCVNHIAEFMGITARAVKNHKETIKVTMLAHGMIPK